MAATLNLKPRALVGRNHPALHAPAAHVTEFDRDLAMTIGHLYATVRSRREGMAIAAPQIGISQRIVVGRDANALMNPIILSHSDATETAREGCLSLPGRFYTVERWAEVTITGSEFDESMKTFTVEGELARMWQHELDHLEGRLISEHWPEI